MIYLFMIYDYDLTPLARNRLTRVRELHAISCLFGQCSSSAPRHRGQELWGWWDTDTHALIFLVGVCLAWRSWRPPDGQASRRCLCVSLCASLASPRCAVLQSLASPPSFLAYLSASMTVPSVTREWFQFEVVLAFLGAPLWRW